MFNWMDRGASFMAVGLVGPTIRRWIGSKPTWPARPAVGAEVVSPFVDMPEHNCFACGPRNPIGLRLRFYEAAGWHLACLWKPGDLHSNYPGMMHGGMIVTVLDELVGHAIYHRVGHLPVTVEAKVRWHKPLKVGDDVVAAARVTGTFDQVYAAHAWLFRGDGKVCADLAGRYFTPTLRQFRSMTTVDSVANVRDEWFAPSKGNGGASR